MACAAPRAALVAVLGLALAGCGPQLYPVRGKVTLEDGEPVTRGLVVFECTEPGVAVSARGTIQSDGTYELSTNRPGDGVPPGRYKVLINSMDLSDLPDEKKQLPYHYRYLRFDTSGLKAEVQAADNDIPLRLARGEKKGSGFN